MLGEGGAMMNSFFPIASEPVRLRFTQRLLDVELLTKAYTYFLKK